MAHHTVFGSSTPPYTVGVWDDGGPSIELGNVFFLTPDNGQAIGWYCKGGRVWIPNDPRVTGKGITLNAYVGTDLTSIDIGSDTPLQQKTTTTPAGGGWCEVLWDTPFLIDYGPQYCWVVITYRFDAPNQMMYVTATDLSLARVNSVDVGATVCLAESPAGGTYMWSRRGTYRIGSNPTNGSDAWYGADIIIDEAPSPVTTSPVAAYGLNEGSGTTLVDATGNGFAVTTTGQYLVPGSGRHAGGLVQLTNNVSATDDTVGAYLAVDTAVNPQFTLMMWARYDSDGQPGANWTVRQTAFNHIATAWGIAVSSGTDAVFTVQIQGNPASITVPRQAAGEWHHYAVVTNGFYLRAYIDGVVVGEFAANGVVAGASDYNIEMFSGSQQDQRLDDVRLFSYALDPNAIQYYMNTPITHGARSGKIKVWSGATWEARPLKVWDGTTWRVYPAMGSMDGVTFLAGKG